jgi:hypothetical protein
MEGGWTYSRACVSILQEYQTRFPEVFMALAATSNNNASDMFHELDVFDGDDDVADRVRELTTWLGMRGIHVQQCQSVLRIRDPVRFYPRDPDQV